MAPARPVAPPKGGLWDLPVGEATYVFVDVEMSGLDLARDSVLEVALVRARGPNADAHVESELTSLVRPAGGVVGATHVHGIDAALLEGAPAFADIADRVRELLEGAIFVAHAPSMDVAFLERELTRAGKPFEIGPTLDTLALARRAFALRSHALGSLARALGIDPGRSHRAADDVRAMRQVFERAVKLLEPKTPRDLFHVRVGEGEARPDIVEALRQASLSKKPVRVRYRPSRRAPEEMRMCVTDVLDGVDPVRVLGYLLPSRSRRELRADRVLAVHDDEAPPKPLVSADSRAAREALDDDSTRESESLELRSPRPLGLDTPKRS